jgi:pantoate--beta-alanine ligase
MRMKVSEHIPDIRRHRRADAAPTWGLVPTMGYLHEGHLSLVKRAKAENDRVAVSIFVNPIQFNNPDDLEKYPRDIERDLALLEQERVDLVWTPKPESVYPPEFQTHVEVERITQLLEGASRPGHFRGVTTVVAKLFNVFQPHRAYFGSKDYQQLAVIRQMVADLNINTEIVACETMREKDGLAMSSRNRNLSSEERIQAVCLYEALCDAKDAVTSGERNADRIRRIMTDRIKKASLSRIDYVSVAHPVSLAELTSIDNSALLSLAVYIGKVRLIDNMEVHV